MAKCTDPTPTDALAALRSRAAGRDMSPGTILGDALALAARLVEERDAAHKDAEWAEHTRQTFENQLNDKLIALRELQAEHARLDAENRRLREEHEAMGHKWVNACDKAHNYERDLDKLRAETAGLVKAATRIKAESIDGRVFLVAPSASALTGLFEALAPFTREAGDEGTGT